MSIIRKIVSGGQTGADRAALDFAMGRGIPHGGGCPNGRRAEDGRVVLMQPGDITDHDHEPAVGIVKIAYETSSKIQGQLAIDAS